MRGSRNAAWVVLLVGLTGCGRAPVPPADTGARDVVREYCDAIVSQDWTRAYATLHPDSHKQWAAEPFSRLAESYRRNLGFEPTKVFIRSCEEQESRAVAHVLFAGGTSHRRQQFKDGLILRQSEGKWRIVLPGNYGVK